MEGTRRKANASKGTVLSQQGGDVTLLYCYMRAGKKKEKCFSINVFACISVCVCEIERERHSFCVHM